MKAPQLSSPRHPLRKNPPQRRPSSNLTVIIEVNVILQFYFLAKDIFTLSENHRVVAAAAIQTRTLT